MNRLRRALFALALAAVVHAAGRAAADPPAPDRVAAALSALGEWVARFGPPCVMVEAERPERAEDRRVVALVLARLAELGIDARDGEATRARRREVADAQARAGAEPEAARRTVDRIESDFVLRVSASVADAGSSETYGMRIERRQCVLAPTLVRSSDAASIKLDPSAAEGASASAATAAETAQRLAAAALAAAVAEAACGDWREVREGGRRWVVEFAGTGPPAGATAGALLEGGATLLEGEPRGRTVMRADGACVARVLASVAPAEVLVHRPGYVRVMTGEAGSAGAAVPAWVLALGGATVLAALAMAFRPRGAPPLAP